MKSLFCRFLLPLLVLSLLTACDGGERQRMEHVLSVANSQNLSFDSITNVDSLTLAVAWYNRHGTSNERMRALYLLGSAYRDMGDAPKALSTYHDAVECADTTEADCDYGLLCRLHAQMSSLLYRMQLPYETLDESCQAEKMSILANDSLMSLDSQILKAHAYSLVGNVDSTISISEYVSRKYLQYGDTMYSILFLKPAIDGYLKKGLLDSAQKALSSFERLIKDTPSNIVVFSKKNFCVLKAQYYLQCQQYDSAFSYYQQAWAIAETPEERLNVLRGFSRYYISKREVDSALKYIELYVSADDSIYRTSVRENFSQMHSLYNYERNQRKAERAEHQLYEWRHRFIAVTFVAIFFIASLILFVRMKREKTKREYQNLNSKYAESLRQYAISKKEMELLKEARESDELLINQLRHEKAADSDTITKLIHKLERNKAKIMQNEEDLRKQATAIAEFQKDKKRPDQWNLEHGLFNLPLLSRLHTMIAKGKQPSDSQLNEVFELTNSMLPAFIPRIQELYPGINRNNLLFCIFTKLRFINSERAVIFNLSYQSVSNRCSFLYRKLTGKKGGASDFEAEIQKMG